jgi:fatty acid desaturase
VEWPTLAVASVVYGSWTGLTLWHEAIPAFALVPLAAWTIAWHSSLQHEILHGHPTRWRGLNRALAAMPLSLWIPFERYRRSTSPTIATSA